MLTYKIIMMSLLLSYEPFHQNFNIQIIYHVSPLHVT